MNEGKDQDLAWTVMAPEFNEVYPERHVALMVPFNQMRKQLNWLKSFLDNEDIFCPHTSKMVRYGRSRSGKRLSTDLLIKGIIWVRAGKAQAVRDKLEKARRDIPVRMLVVCGVYWQFSEKELSSINIDEMEELRYLRKGNTVQFREKTSPFRMMGKLEVVRSLGNKVLARTNLMPKPIWIEKRLLEKCD